MRRDAQTDPRVTGVILAGGKARRLQGADKGLVNYGGRPLIEWVIERLRPQVDEMLISANRNLARYADYGFPVLRDSSPDFLGPLAGVEAALTHCTHDWILTAPCDTPNLPLTLSAKLQEAISTNNLPIAIAASPSGLQPTVALIHRDMLDALKGYLERGERRVLGWLLSQPHCVVTFPEDKCFLNLNSPDQFNQI